MKRVIVIVALLIGTPLVALAATTVPVGETSLKIPEPKGYVAVTPQMSEINRLLAQFIPPVNKLLAAFIPASEAPIAASRELPDPSSYFLVEVARSIIHSSISDSDFIDLKNHISSTNNETVRRVEQQFPDLIKRINESITKKYGVDFAGATVNAIPLPIHNETNDAFAYSAFVKYSLPATSNRQSSNAVVVTTTFIHIKGKVIFLYCFSRAGNLTWTQSASENWANAVIEANR